MAERADNAADAMDAEHVERVVIAKPVLDHGDEEQADDADDQAEHERSHRAGIAGRGRDRDQSGDRTGNLAPSTEGWALDHPFREHP